MTGEIAFVGDVHGNLLALRGLWHAIDTRGADRAVFLGDYLNKGKDSRGVIETLLDYQAMGRVTLLKGNHETAVLDAFDTGELATFLKMGGAMTIRSYVGHRSGPDVLDEFRASFPSDHLEALRHMPETFETDDVVAQHIPRDGPSGKYTISAHVPVGQLPRLRRNSAQIDTGCGGATGRLTALFWPSLDYIQVDDLGGVIEP